MGFYYKIRSLWNFIITMNQPPSRHHHQDYCLSNPLSGHHHYKSPSPLAPLNFNHRYHYSFPNRSKMEASFNITNFRDPKNFGSRFAFLFEPRAQSSSKRFDTRLNFNVCIIWSNQLYFDTFFKLWAKKYLVALQQLHTSSLKAIIAHTIGRLAIIALRNSNCTSVSSPGRPPRCSMVAHCCNFPKIIEPSLLYY